MTQYQTYRAIVDALPSPKTDAEWALFHLWQSAVTNADDTACEQGVYDEDRWIDWVLTSASALLAESDASDETRAWFASHGLDY